MRKMFSSLVIGSLLLGHSIPIVAAEESSGTGATVSPSVLTFEQECRLENNLPDGTLQGALLFILRRCVGTKGKLEQERLGIESRRVRHIERSIRTSSIYQKATNRLTNSGGVLQFTRYLRHRLDVLGSQRQDLDARRFRTKLRTDLQLKEDDAVQYDDELAKPNVVSDELQECLSLTIAQRWMCIHRRRITNRLYE